jgi:ATP-dependent DNA helicase PIF1
MDANDATLTCAVNLEWTNAQGTVHKRLQYKKADLRLLRNSLKEILIEVTGEKASAIKLKVKNVNVHKKFMIDGKASIKFVDDKCTLYMSNARK